MYKNKSGKNISFAVAVVLSTIFCLTPFSDAKAQTNTEYNLEDLDIPKLVRVLNKDRAGVGLHPLRRNSTLDKIAQFKAEDMVKQGYFAHTSPEGIDPWHWFSMAGYEYVYAGENLALDFNDAESVQKAWMASQKHRENVLNPNYEEVGYAVAYGTFTNVNGDKKTRTGPIVVQVFGKRLPSVLTDSGGTAKQPVPSPVSSSQNSLALVTMEKIAEAAGNLSARMFSNVVDYSHELDTNPSVASQQTQVKPKRFNTTPPIETWPFVSFGLALLVFSAGIHTKIL